VDRQARGLVEDEDLVVLVEDRDRDRLGLERTERRSGRRDVDLEDLSLADEGALPERAPPGADAALLDPPLDERARRRELGSLADDGVEDEPIETRTVEGDGDPEDVLDVLVLYFAVVIEAIDQSLSLSSLSIPRS
jgi:hypothetical protein